MFVRRAFDVPRAACQLPEKSLVLSGGRVLLFVEESPATLRGAR